MLKQQQLGLDKTLITTPRTNLAADVPINISKPASIRTNSASQAAQFQCLSQTDVNVASPRIHNQRDYLNPAYYNNTLTS